MDLIVLGLSSIRITPLLLLVLFGQGCRAGAVPAKSSVPTQEVTLESGRVIRIIEISHDKEEGTLELEYMTSLRILEDHQALQYEAEEIWAEFLEQQANAVGADIAYLSPADNSPPVLGMSFRIERVGPGKWCKQGGFAYPLKLRQSC